LESLKKYIKMMRDFDGRFFFRNFQVSMQKGSFACTVKYLHFRGGGEGDFSQGYITTNSQVQEHRAHFLIIEMTGSLNFRGGFRMSLHSENPPRKIPPIFGGI